MTNPMVDLGRTHMGLVLGATAHPQTVIDDLWSRARDTASARERTLSVVAVYLYSSEYNLVAPDPALQLVALASIPEGKIQLLLREMSRRHGPAGIAGRLLRDNFNSRRVARALRKNDQARKQLCRMDLVISADPLADRAVWQLRKKSQALLMHGAIAMIHGLNELHPVTSLD